MISPEKIAEMLAAPTQEFTLRAMATNYGDGPHKWDFLDKEACAKAADEIAALRSELLTLRAERDEAWEAFGAVDRSRPLADHITSALNELAAQADEERKRAEAAEAQLARQGEALKAIAAERQRQIEVEGWTPEHDDAHTGGEMAHAAACYALGRTELRLAGVTEHFWPWDRSWWKPKDRESDLIRAGALIAAELDRLRRARSTLSPEDSHG